MTNSIRRVSAAGVFGRGRSSPSRCWGSSALIVVSILAAQRKADAAYAHLDSLNARYRDVETRLRRVRSGLHLSGILARDYLLDTTTPAADYRSRLVAYHVESEQMIRRARAAAARERPGTVPRAAAPARRILARVCAAVRRHDQDRSLWLSAPRDRAAARCRHADLGRDRGDQQPHPARAAAGGGRAAARAAPVPHGTLAASLTLGLAVAIIAVIRIRVLEAAHRATARTHAAGRRGTAAALEPARADAGRGAQEPLARAA